MAAVILEARGLAYAYPGGVAALSGLDLAVKRGQRLAILGPTGAGKTTLLLHLNGTLKPSAGSVLLDGDACAYSRSAVRAWRRRVGLVLQEPDDQLFAATVFEDVSFGPLNLGLAPAEARARVERTLADLHIAALAERPPHLLSFGQKKRVALAGAVAMEPDVLLLDEPTAGLDHHGARHLLAVLDRLAAAGTTLVFTTHDVDLAYGWADEVALFDGGRVGSQGKPETVLADARSLARAHLRMPLVLALGLAARAAGVLGADDSLPHSHDDALALFERGVSKLNRVV
ncbi:MAG: ABC transporter ATP-binding protein [Magnetospirillum sp.]|nr:ABC transporter ATP-binding protein [Magnetospirillum sp.]